MIGASAGVLLGLLTLAWCAGAAQAAPRCAPHGHGVRGVPTSKVLELTASAIVYRTGPISGELAPETTDVWACGRRSERFVRIGSEETDDEYGTEGALSDFQLAGSWLLVRQDTGVTAAAECQKYMVEDAEGCPPISESLLLADLARGLVGGVTNVNPLPGGKVAPVTVSLLSPAGALAWLQTPEMEAVSSLYGCAVTLSRHALQCRRRLLAQGAITSASLHLAGTTLSWSAGGQTASSVL